MKICYIWICLRWYVKDGRWLGPKNLWSSFPSRNRCNMEERRCCRLGELVCCSYCEIMQSWGTKRLSYDIVPDEPRHMLVMLCKDLFCTLCRISWFDLLASTHHTTLAYDMSDRTIEKKMFVFTQTGRGHRLDRIGCSKPCFFLASVLFLKVKASVQRHP